MELRITIEQDEEGVFVAECPMLLKEKLDQKL